ncbi:MAG TPA: MoaD/ThiS family protein [Anaerolineales bacterium]|nr:MoaD/ThiS family protein [Anaerolineales bacterium]
MMKISVKLLATYRDKLPPDAEGSTCIIEVPEGSRVDIVLERFEISNDNTNVILVNGHSPENSQSLKEGDVVCIFSAMAGG